MSRSCSVQNPSGPPHANTGAPQDAAVPAPVPVEFGPPHPHRSRVGPPVRDLGQPEGGAAFGPGDRLSGPTQPSTAPSTKSEDAEVAVGRERGRAGRGGAQLLRASTHPARRRTPPAGRRRR